MDIKDLERYTISAITELENAPVLCADDNLLVSKFIEDESFEQGGWVQSRQISAGQIEQFIADTHYRKGETSSSVELSNHFRLFEPISALERDYYSKTQTSSDQELADAFEQVVPVSELTAYYRKNETSSAVQLATEFTHYVNYQNVDVTSFTDSDAKVPSSKLVTTLSGQLSGEINKDRQDISTIYDLLKTVEADVIIEHGRGSEFTLKNFAVNVCQLDGSGKIYLLISDKAATPGSEEDVSRSFYVLAVNDKDQEANIKLGPDNVTFWSDVEGTLNILMPNTTVLFFFKEQQDNKFFVKRWELNQVQAEAVKLVSLTTRYFPESGGDQIRSDIVTTTDKDGKRMKAGYEWTMDEALSLQGYSFLYYWDGADKYNPNDKYVLTDDTTISAIYSKDTDYFIRFKHQDTGNIISAYEIYNKIIIAPRDEAGNVPTSVTFPVVSRPTQVVTWDPAEIPDYKTLTADVDIFAVWKDKETEDEPLDDEDLVYKITKTDGASVETGPLTDDQIQNSIILLKLGETSDEYLDLAASERDDSFITVI